MIGGWPLFAEDALKWEPGTVKVGSVMRLGPSGSVPADQAAALAQHAGVSKISFLTITKR